MRESIRLEAAAGWMRAAAVVMLHFEVSKTHPGAPTCECGADGLGCSASHVPWSSFWPNATYPTVPIVFDEWPATSSCGNRRMTMPASQN